MTGRLLLRFLSGRVGLMAAYYASTALVLTLAGLVFSHDGASQGSWAHLAYGLLLSTTVLLGYLAFDLARWWPFARQTARLLEGSADLEALANLPPAQTADQADFRALMSRLYSLSVSERLRYEDSYRRHLTFMNAWFHQMKSPVAAIDLLAQRGQSKPTEELPATLESIEEEAARLAEGLDLVLNMARLQEFAVDFRVEQVDLQQAVREVINQRKKQFVRSEIFPVLEVADGDWTVLTDAKWNGVLLDQIVANALKYGAQAGPQGQKLTFAVSRRVPDEVVLSISDQGPGIPPEDLPRVFDAFFTGANGRRFAGATGIGLYLVRLVATELGHTVQVESTVGQGTTVTITYAATLQHR